MYIEFKKKSLAVGKKNIPFVPDVEIAISLKK